VAGLKKKTGQIRSQSIWGTMNKWVRNNILLIVQFY